MIYRIRPSIIQGQIALPPSKSHTLRALLFGLMGKGKTLIHYPLNSPDTRAMISACKLFGAEISSSSDAIEVIGVNGQIEALGPIDAGNSGIVLRFMGALAALGTKPIIITGDDSLQNLRPIQPLIKGLSQLGTEAYALKGNGHAPISIKGPIIPNIAHIDGADSQPVSGLIMACAFAKGTSEILVSNPGEKPWIDLTLSWLDRLGIAYEREGYERYRLFGGASYEGFTYEVPGDFSTAAFLMAAAIVTDSEITLTNVDMNDPQGDKKVIGLLQKMGANIECSPKTRSLTLKRGGELCGMTIDVNDFIDALPILAVIGCFANGKTVIVNGKIARKKECDRISCIAKELKKMGAKIEETDDGLIIEQSRLKGAHVYSHKDHRIAMSLAVAGLAAEGETVVEDVDCIAKTYPDFFNDFTKLGSKIEV